MSYINDHVNVYSTCVELLAIKGWEIEIEPGPYEECDSLLDSYVAIKNGTTIRAGNPLALLGLAEIHEYHHPHSDESYWWRIKCSGLMERLEVDALERSFLEYIEKSPNEWKDCMRKAIEESKSDPEIGAHDRIGISINTFEDLLKNNPDI